nr:MAG TPA_asm: MqsA [Caudoviricetes sp.]
MIFEPICKCSTAELGDITAYYCPRCEAEMEAR